MSQTNTNTNNGQNRNQISRRDGRGQGGINGSSPGDRLTGRRNNLIKKYSFEEKMKDGPISKLTITKTGIDLLNSGRLVKLFLYYVQIGITEAR